MRSRSILWHLFPYNLAIIIVSLLVVSLYLYSVVADLHIGATREFLTSSAYLLERSLRHIDMIGMDASNSIDSLCKDIGALTGTRATVVLASGRVVGDSDEKPSSMENHRSRPEIASALSGRLGVSKRFSDTTRRRELYVAVPMYRGDNVVAAIRVSKPLVAIDRMLQGVRLRLAMTSAVAAFLAGIASYVFARRVSGPLDQVKHGLERFTRNDLSYRLPGYRIRELDSLAHGLNEMADSLSKRMSEEVRRRNELEAILSAMIEGLIVVDTAARVVRMNKTAADFIGLKQEAIAGKGIHEIVRNPELQQFIEAAISSSELLERDLVISDSSGDRFFQAHGTQLHEADGTRVGAVIVLNDVTRLKRLEKIRKDFVANVSHELKTPITSIKGFVETLRDGALQDRDKADRYFEIISKQVDRMNAIIEDLLFLSRLEQGDERERILLERISLKKVITEAIEMANHKAKQKGISIVLDCPEDVVANINPALLEQAVLNLLDNAIKYSEDGESIGVSVRKAEKEVIIDVIDNGCGIEEQHLERIFERFYRVDKARSRSLGGTGLGLAIVKHIAQVHDGRVSVRSKPGAGSTFTIHLPLS